MEKSGNWRRKVDEVQLLWFPLFMALNGLVSMENTWDFN
jgi:hypothetical protein